jgi:hypothetical protein
MYKCPTCGYTYATHRDLLDHHYAHKPEGLK